MPDYDQTDLLILALKKLDAIDDRLSALEARHPKPKPRPRSNPYNAGEPRSYASAIKAFWSKKNV